MNAEDALKAFFIEHGIEKRSELEDCPMEKHLKNVLAAIRKKISEELRNGKYVIPAEVLEAIEAIMAENAAVRLVAVERLVRDLLGLGDGDMDRRFPSTKQIKEKVSNENHRR